MSSSVLIPPGIAHRTLPCFPACGQFDSPRSLLLITALEARSRGPCWVKWYPNFSREVFFSKILAISISTLLPKGWLFWKQKSKLFRLEGDSEQALRGKGWRLQTSLWTCVHFWLGAGKTNPWPVPVDMLQLRGSNFSSRYSHKSFCPKTLFLGQISS